MTSRYSRHLPKDWCSIHKDDSAKLDVQCPVCHAPTHVHANAVMRAKRREQPTSLCTRCNRSLLLQVSVNSRSVGLVAQEDGLPVIQGKLPLKVRQEVPHA